MNQRTLLALVLTALVIVVTPMVFPGARQTRTRATADSLAPRAATGATATAAPTTMPAVAAARPDTGARGTAAPAAPSVPAETLSVVRGPVTYRFTNQGASLVGVHIDDTLYRDLRPGERGRGAGVTLAEPNGRLLDLRLLSGRDTIALDTLPFRGAANANGVTFTSAGTPAVTVAYAFGSAPYQMQVTGNVAGTTGRTWVLLSLPERLRSVEADTLDDQRHAAFSIKAEKGDVESIGFAKLDTTLAKSRVDTGPFRWVAMRNKYFLVAAIAPDSNADFLTFSASGAEKSDRILTRARGVALAPLAADGSFRFQLYTGPQSWDHLHRIGHDLQNVNPYAGWFHGVVQPFSTIVMRVLLWMKATLQINYGWVLVIFGVVIRLLLWPLNQNAMRSSIKMQRLQPELQAVQAKYKTDPEKQREALMALYREHGMSPFSPLMGCLPMLLPMPVLFALYFVFQNTIEFRGVPFLWLPDLALKDPYYITPVFMGLSMFVLSWIGMRNMPPNPQSKMMAYMMPGMLTVMFLNFPSGLNLYYAVQNIAALPQQWLIAHERAKSGPAPTAAPIRPGRPLTGEVRGDGGSRGGRRRT